jgi:hypothetical protein
MLVLNSQGPKITTTIHFALSWKEGNPSMNDTVMPPLMEQVRAAG